MMKNIKYRLKMIIVWLAKNPKNFYKYSMLFLIVSYIGCFVKEFYFPSKIEVITKPPVMMYQNDDSKINSNLKEAKLAKIVNELKLMKVKRDKGIMTEQDSLRVDYLFNKYQKIKNEY